MPAVAGLRDYKPLHREIVHPSWGALDAQERKFQTAKLKMAAARSKIDPSPSRGPTGFRPPPAPVRRNVFQRLSVPLFVLWCRVLNMAL